MLKQRKRDWSKGINKKNWNKKLSIERPSQAYNIIKRIRFI